MHQDNTTLQAATARLKECGYKITPARLELLKVFARAVHPLTISEIHQQADQRMNKTTVYRTLATLGDAQCIAKSVFKDEHVYELVTRHRHYVVCKSCSKTQRLPSCALGSLDARALGVTDTFARIYNHTAQFIGVCNRCNSA